MFFNQAWWKAEDGGFRIAFQATINICFFCQHDVDTQVLAIEMSLVKRRRLDDSFYTDVLCSNLLDRTAEYEAEAMLRLC
jgi:hypothetical protein